MGQVIFETGVLLVALSVHVLCYQRVTETYNRTFATQLGVDALRRLLGRHGSQALDRWNPRCLRLALTSEINDVASARWHTGGDSVLLRLSGWALLTLVSYLVVLRSVWVLSGVLFDGGASVNVLAVVAVWYLAQGCRRLVHKRLDRATVAWARQVVGTHEDFAGTPTHPPLWGTWRPRGDGDGRPAG